MRLDKTQISTNPTEYEAKNFESQRKLREEFTTYHNGHFRVRVTEEPDDQPTLMSFLVFLWRFLCRRPLDTNPKAYFVEIHEACTHMAWPLSMTMQVRRTWISRQYATKSGALYRAMKVKSKMDRRQAAYERERDDKRARDHEKREAEKNRRNRIDVVNIMTMDVDSD